MDQRTSVAIVGGGFSGMLTAVQLSLKTTEPLKIYLINAASTFGRGIAFDPYSELHLLNVMAGKMSAFPDAPDHFVEWILTLDEYKKLGKDLISKTYLPRTLYGRYLDFVWQETLKNKKESVEIHQINGEVTDVTNGHPFIIHLRNEESISADSVVLATGNSIPGTPFKNNDISTSVNYFADPWGKKTVQNLKSKNDILIIGNGLTMVDTVLGLREAGFTKKIYSISPDGFSILQHRHNGLSYPNMAGELKEPYHLRDLVRLFNKHRKAIRTLGLSAEPVIDSLRPYTQAIWTSLSVDEKKEFMSRLRHMWGVARHRLPIHVHDLIVRLKLDGKLLVRAGKINEMKESNEGITVKFFNKKTKEIETILVERVINCTGPESDLTKSSNRLLQTLASRGTLMSDPLKLGALAKLPEYLAVDKEGRVVDGLYLIGNILRGMLWESTAVPEIRSQANDVAGQILKRIKLPLTVK